MLFLFKASLPHVWELESKNPKTSSFMDLYRDDNPDRPLRHQWVSYSQISNHLKRAVLILEDDTFMDHHGFNFEQMKSAIEKKIQKGKEIRGASTITQQLAKNLYLWPNKSLYRKAVETLITIRLERHLSKKRILELYLNVVEWGPGIFGAQAAAQYYFKKPAAQLSPSEAAFLASILPNPKKLKAHNGIVRLKTRTALTRLHTQAIP